MRDGTGWFTGSRRCLTHSLDPFSALVSVSFVGFDDASKGGVGLRLQSADDRHSPAPDAVTRRTQHCGPAAAGHRLRRLDHVTCQRDNEVEAVKPGQRRVAAA